MVDITTAVATIKMVTGVVRDAGRIDLTQQVIDLQQTLLALIAENTEWVDKNRQLQQENHKLTEQISAHETLHYSQNAYWRGEGEQKEGPFCSRCLDVDLKAVRMTLNTVNVGLCPNCKTPVRLDGPAQPRQRRTISRGAEPW